MPLVLHYIPLDVVDEVIIVDGRSKDNTISVAKQLLPSVKIILEKTPGKGAAMRAGFREAKGDILVVLDADGSNDPREIPRFIQKLIEGADFVKGSRFAASGGTTDMPRLRKYGNLAFVIIVNFLFSQTFTDLCYGYHAFWRHSLEFLELDKIDGFEVDTAIYLQAVRKKLKVVDVPSFEGFRFYGEGKLQTFPDGWRVLCTILKEWMISLRNPPIEPQVGFRSYARKPGPQVGFYIPMTGLDLNSPLIERYPNISTDQKCFGLNAFFTDHWPKVSKDESQRILYDVLLTVMEELGASSGSLVILDDQKRVSEGYRMFGRNIVPIESGEMDDTLSQGITGWAVKNKKAVIVNNTLTDPRWMNRAWEKEEGVSRTALVVPCTVNEEVMGVLALTRPSDRPFTSVDLKRLSVLPFNLTA